METSLSRTADTLAKIQTTYLLNISHVLMFKLTYPLLSRVQLKYSLYEGELKILKDIQFNMQQI